MSIGGGQLTLPSIDIYVRTGAVLRSDEVLVDRLKVRLLRQTFAIGLAQVPDRRQHALVLALEGLAEWRGLVWSHFTLVLVHWPGPDRRRLRANCVETGGNARH